MPKMKILYKIITFTPRVANEVSKHRFSGSGNHFLTLDIMYNKEKPLIGA